MGRKIKDGTDGRISVIVAGFGLWGAKWAERIVEHPDFELAGIVHPRQVLGKEQAEQLGLPDDRVHTDTAKAIDDLNPDAVVVVVSPDRHGEVVEIAAERGLHILSEKPLAKDIEEARRFLQIARTNPDRQFMVSQNYRGRPHNQTMKKAISEGKIGRIGMINVNHHQTCRISGYRMEMAHPVLEDMAIHHFDLIRFFAGRNFTEVYARGGAPPWSWFKGKPLSSLLFSMEEGISGVYMGSWATEGLVTSWDGIIQVLGEDGALELTRDGRVHYFPKHALDEDNLGVAIPPEELPLVEMSSTELDLSLDMFARAVRTGEKAETDIEDNFHSYIIVPAALKSLRESRPVNIAELMREEA